MSPLPNDSEGYSGLSAAREEAAKRQARKWFVILLTIGLVLGGILSVGVVKILNHFGLTAKPERTLPTQPQERSQ